LPPRERKRSVETRTQKELPASEEETCKAGERTKVSNGVCMTQRLLEGGFQGVRKGGGAAFAEAIGKEKGESL